MFGKTPQASGPQMMLLSMLQSMGLGDVVGQMQQFATDGSLQRVLKFADDLEGLNSNVVRLCEGVEELLSIARAQSGPVAGDGGPLLLGGPGDGTASPGEPEPAGRSRRGRGASGGSDDGSRRDIPPDGSTGSAEHGAPKVEGSS